MGLWTVVRVTPSFTPNAAGPAATSLGHTFSLTVEMRHTPTPREPFSHYAEMPRIIWREKIVFKDHTSGRFWEWGDVESQSAEGNIFQGDLYSYRPTAATFAAWRSRYILAYRAAAGQPPIFANAYGSAVLTMNRQPVSLRAIDHASNPPSSAFASMRRMIKDPVPATTDEARASAIRAFIHQNDCTLTVTLIDRPAVTNIANRRFERLLLFNCGVPGHMIRAHQLLRNHDDAGPVPPLQQFALNWPTPPTLPVDGMLPNLDNAIGNMQYDRDLLGTPGVGNHALSLQIGSHLLDPASGANAGEYR